MMCRPRATAHRETTAEILRISMRKVNRVKRRLAEEGLEAARDRRPSYVRKADGEIEARVVALNGGDNIDSDLGITELRHVVASHGLVGSCLGIIRIGFPFGKFWSVENACSKTFLIGTFPLTEPNN